MSSLCKQGRPVASAPPPGRSMRTRRGGETVASPVTLCCCAPSPCSCRSFPFLPPTSSPGQTPHQQHVCWLCPLPHHGIM